MIAELKVYANTLYAGDILAGEAACVVTPSYNPSPPSQGGSGSSQKIQQQRALAAQVIYDTPDICRLSHLPDYCDGSEPELSCDMLSASLG